MKLLKIEHEVKNRLSELDLTKDDISKIARRAIAQKLNAVSNHPVNAPGTFAYHEGVRAMRDILVDGDRWKKLTDNGIEFIENPKKRIKVIYQNVDQACDIAYAPQPITKRGGKAKRNAINSNQPQLFANEDMPQIHQSNVWVICVSEKNKSINAEISLPTEICEDGYFFQFSERIFILQDDNLENQASDIDDASQDQYNDEIKISFKG